MAKWWYWSTYTCPSCGAKDYQYDPSGPWYDSGLSSSLVFEKLCEECADGEEAPEASEL